MYAKIFAQIFESTIAEDYIARHVFMDLLVLADEDGVIDKTPQSIARITNVPLDFVVHGLEVLGNPDEKSRTKIEGGRRIVLIDEGRDWGWKIVNYAKYREMRDEEARRIANRSYKREQRARERGGQTQPTNVRVTKRYGNGRQTERERIAMLARVGQYIPPPDEKLN